jgi:hypothetical protein
LHSQVFFELFLGEADQVFAFDFVVVEVALVLVELHVLQKLEHVFDAPGFYVCVEKIQVFQSVVFHQSKLF